MQLILTANLQPICNMNNENTLKKRNLLGVVSWLIRQHPKQKMQYVSTKTEVQKQSLIWHRHDISLNPVEIFS